ncbi:hypothetical protein ACFV9W_00855 [Streptomyces sp. NPDC059897]|uniref:hypothetical protein n=1 Tax=Streptomyces sp. NPDC059897 TaxID=3346994 RepID=UPI00364F4538
MPTNFETAFFSPTAPDVLDDGLVGVLVLGAAVDFDGLGPAVSPGPQATRVAAAVQSMTVLTMRVRMDSPWWC